MLHVDLLATKCIRVEKAERKQNSLQQKHPKAKTLFFQSFIFCLKLSQLGFHKLRTAWLRQWQPNAAALLTFDFPPFIPLPHG